MEGQKQTTETAGSAVPADTASLNEAFHAGMAEGYRLLVRDLYFYALAFFLVSIIARKFWPE